MTLADILEKSSKDFGDKTALTMRMGYRTISLSYRDVYNLSAKIALFLEKQELKRGDKVLICAANSPYWISVFLGCELRGFIPVPLNIQSTAELVQKIAAQTEAKAIFKDRRCQEKLPAGLKAHEIELVKELSDEFNVEHFQKTPLAEEDIAEIMYTSGTTGDPKGVLLTHKNINSNLEAIAKIAPISAETDKFLSILPLSHIFEQVIGFWLPFSKGVPIIYAHSRTAIRDLLKEHHITVMAVVPEFLQIVISRIESRIPKNALQIASAVNIRFLRRLLFWPVLRKFGGKLHTIISGGAPLDPTLENKWNALGIYLLQGYGLTETSPVLSTNTYENRRLGSVGKVMPGVEIKIAPDGEVLARGPNIFQGYFKNQEKTRESFTPDGWFKTGDIGFLDKDDFLFLRGRKKYMIKGPGAQNVYPEDIEFELNKMSGVKDSSIVGLEKTGGQVEIHAVLLPDAEKPFENADSVIETANKKLASYQRITGWSVWPEADFPRSATRKVKKEEVLRWLKERKPAATKPLTDEAETPLTRLLAGITGVSLERITPNTKIVPELNLDSLLRVELTARIEEELGKIIDEAKIGPLTTVADLEDLVKAGGQVVESKWRFKNWPRMPLASFLRDAFQTLAIFPIFKIFVRLKIEGQENLKNLPSPAVFMPNHLSYLDSVVILMSLPRSTRKKIAFAAATDLLYEHYNIWSKPAELLFNAFPFPRHEQENIKFGLDYLGKLLDQNWSVVIYPEGQMSLTGDLLPLKRGAGLIATVMDVYIVPVKIYGTQNILPPGKFLPKKHGEVNVKFGKPIKFKRSDSYIKVTEKIQKILAKL